MSVVQRMWIQPKVQDSNQDSDQTFGEFSPLEVEGTWSLGKETVVEILNSKRCCRRDLVAEIVAQDAGVYGRTARQDVLIPWSFCERLCCGLISPGTTYKLETQIQEAARRVWAELEFYRPVEISFASQSETSTDEDDRQSSHLAFYRKKDMQCRDEDVSIISDENSERFGIGEERDPLLPGAGDGALNGTVNPAGSTLLVPNREEEQREYGTCREADEI